MTPEELMRRLAPVQEAQGYFFHPDRERTLDLLEGLLRNRDRYGYMGCPCRLACGDLQWDRDIICPCEYRKADVAEFGCCYCGLYVNKRKWGPEDEPEEPVPERRSPEKFR